MTPERLAEIEARAKRRSDTDVRELVAALREAQATLERVRKVAYGNPDLFITADSPPPHTEWIDATRLRTALGDYGH